MNRDEFYQYQERSFHQFCKTLIRNAAADCKKALARRLSCETAYMTLASTENSPLCYGSHVDTINLDQKLFSAQGHSVLIRNGALGEAMRLLLPDQRDIILLYYFWDYSDSTISKMLNCSPETVRLRRHAALKRLRRELEAIADDI